MDVLLVILVLAVIAWALSRTPKVRRALKKRSAASRTRALEHRYRRLLHMPPPAAEETLARQLAGLSAQHPERSREWMLKKLISDLERARR